MRGNKRCIGSSATTALALTEDCVVWQVNAETERAFPVTNLQDMDKTRREQLIGLQCDLWSGAMRPYRRMRIKRQKKVFGIKRKY